MALIHQKTLRKHVYSIKLPPLTNLWVEYFQFPFLFIIQNRINSSNQYQFGVISSTVIAISKSGGRGKGTTAPHYFKWGCSASLDVILHMAP